MNNIQRNLLNDAIQPMLDRKNKANEKIRKLKEQLVIAEEEYKIIEKELIQLNEGL